MSGGEDEHYGARKLGLNSGGGNLGFSMAREMRSRLARRVKQLLSPSPERRFATMSRSTCSASAARFNLKRAVGTGVSTSVSSAKYHWLCATYQWRDCCGSRSGWGNLRSPRGRVRGSGSRGCSPSEHIRERFAPRQAPAGCSSRRAAKTHDVRWFKAVDIVSHVLP